jgi:hypothetical protein
MFTRISTRNALEKKMHRNPRHGLVMSLIFLQLVLTVSCKTQNKGDSDTEVKVAPNTVESAMHSGGIGRPICNPYESAAMEKKYSNIYGTKDCVIRCLSYIEGQPLDEYKKLYGQVASGNTINSDNIDDKLKKYGFEYSGGVCGTGSAYNRVDAFPAGKYLCAMSSPSTEGGHAVVVEKTHSGNITTVDPQSKKEFTGLMTMPGSNQTCYEFYSKNQKDVVAE